MASKEKSESYAIMYNKWNDIIINNIAQCNEKYEIMKKEINIEI